MKQKLIKKIYTTLAKDCECLYHQAFDKEYWSNISSTLLLSIVIGTRESINSKWLSTS
jgi:hypothetical protein